MKRQFLLSLTKRVDISGVMQRLVESWHKTSRPALAKVESVPTQLAQLTVENESPDEKGRLLKAALASSLVSHFIIGHF
jgi:hypothetical protein